MSEGGRSSTVGFISTDDETRVHLNEGPDYINANFVNVSVVVVVVVVIPSKGKLGVNCHLRACRTALILHVAVCSNTSIIIITSRTTLILVHVSVECVQ